MSREWVIDDDFLDEETKSSADGQGYLTELVRCKDCKKYNTDDCMMIHGKALIIDRIDEQPTADVVEADKAQKEIDYWHDKAQSYEQTILKLSLNKADVVEVVRCKDCRYWQNYNDVMVCGLTNAMMSISDYCSYGERADT